MIRKFLFFLLCVLMWPAVAQTAPVKPKCLPWPASASADGWSGGKLTGGLSRNGAWVSWQCFKQGMVTTHTYVGTTAELSKVGSRLQTIMKAPDPLKSLQTAPNRFTILPIDDPSLAAVVADMNSSDTGVRVSFSVPAIPALITAMVDTLTPPNTPTRGHVVSPE